MILKKDKCYPDFLIRLFNDKDEEFVLIKALRNDLEVERRVK